MAENEIELTESQQTDFGKAKRRFERVHTRDLHGHKKLVRSQFGKDCLNAR